MDVFNEQAGVDIAFEDGKKFFNVALTNGGYKDPVVNSGMDWIEEEVTEGQRTSVLKKSTQMMVKSVSENIKGVATLGIESGALF